MLFLNNLTLKAQRVSRIKVTAANARQYRDSLKLKIFGTTVFPYNILPDSVITNVSSLDYYNSFPYSSIQFPNGNLDSVDKMVVTIDTNTLNFPYQAKVYLYHPHNSNGKLFIYHSGHCAGNATAEDIFENADNIGIGTVIPKLIAEGYTVLSVPMLNYRHDPPVGYVCGYNLHDQLFSDNQYAHPLGLFFKSLIASLNQLGRSNYAAIYMCGLSGGGWTTSVYPAIDSSISVSFPVAGSWPIPVRNVYYTGGDTEQYYAPVFKNLLDYHEIYTLACLAPARKMLQINNRYDPCCFSGSFQHVFYVDSVAKALEGTGGDFKFYLDETVNRHAITNKAMQVMFKFIEGDQARLATSPEDTVSAGMSYVYNIKNNFFANQLSPNSTLTYSLLKSPSWITLDGATGEISGQVPSGTLFRVKDTVSFKVEDSLGRFVVFNLTTLKKREAPYFFTMFGDSQTVYFLPFYSGSLQSINQFSRNYFYFNNPNLNIDSISILKNSFIKINLNVPLNPNDSIGYNGMNAGFPITYTNREKMEDFDLSPIFIDAVKDKIAVIGMIRFNTDSRKFEYFNGLDWINMN